LPLFLKEEDFMGTTPKAASTTVIPLMLPMNMSLLMIGNLSGTLFVNRWNSWKAGIYYRPDVSGSVRRI
jgi:hypothetical protein